MLWLVRIIFREDKESTGGQIGGPFCDRSIRAARVFSMYLGIEDFRPDSESWGSRDEGRSLLLTSYLFICFLAREPMPGKPSKGLQCPKPSFREKVIRPPIPG